MIQDAGKLVEECINTESFRAWCLNHKANGQRDGKPGFHYTKDSPEEVYKKIMSGAETLDPVEDGEADIYVELDRSFSWSAIGYTYENTKWQWIYNRFFKGATVAGIAGNLAHEWCHKIGYDHEFKWTELREHSVPYAVGYYVESYSEKANKLSYFQRFKSFFA